MKDKKFVGINSNHITNKQKGIDSKEKSFSDAKLQYKTIKCKPRGWMIKIKKEAWGGVSHKAVNPYSAIGLGWEQRCRSCSQITHIHTWKLGE